MAKKKATDNIEEIEPDMTPMIDVTFQLIIFFICTIKFKTLEGKLETQLPKDIGVNAAPVDILLDKIEVHIRVDASMPEGFAVILNGRTMPNMATLRAQLTNLTTTSPDIKATLYPQKGVNYEMVVKVVDQCIMTGLLDITFAGVAFDQ